MLLPATYYKVGTSHLNQDVTDRRDYQFYSRIGRYMYDDDEVDTGAGRQPIVYISDEPEETPVRIMGEGDE